MAPITKADACGFEQVAIQTYGGGLWHTWFDRPLSLAGRVIVRNSETEELEEKIWKHEEPLLQIPSLAIHLSSERGEISWDDDKNLRPIIATTIIDQLIDPTSPEEEEKRDDPYGVQKKHLSSLLKLIADELHVEQECIMDFDLSLYDISPAQLVGLHKEFISSPRLDNMLSSLTATYSLIERAEEVTEERTIESTILYDHEEIGSVSA